MSVSTRPLSARIPFIVHVLPVLVLSGCFTPLGRPETFRSGPIWTPPARPTAVASPATIAQADLPDVLDLETATGIAFRGNPDLRTAFMRVEAARARLWSTLSAYLPGVDGRVSYVKTFEVPQQRSVRGINQETELHGIALRGTWLLFDGLAREYRTRAARHSVTETEATHDDARRLLRMAVEGAYFDALGAVENVRIAEADLAYEKELLDETARRYAAGDRSLSDRLNFEVRVQTATAALIETRSRVATLRVALAELLGVADGVLPDRVRLGTLGAESAADLTPPDVAALVKEGLRSRPDLAAAAASAARAGAEVGAADSGWWPSITMVGEIGAQRFGNAHYRSEDSASSVSLEATWNFFSGGATLAARREALAEERAAEGTLARVRNGVISEIRQASEAVTAAQRKLETQREKLSLTRQTRDLVRKEYDAGHATLVRLNEAQRDFVVSEAQLVAERVNLRTAWAVLRSAVGRR